MKLSKDWETVLERLPQDVRNGRRYFALSDLDKVTIMVTSLYVAVRAYPQAELNEDETQLRNELKKRLAQMTGDNNPIHVDVRFAGRPDEEEWRYSTLRL